MIEFRLRDYLKANAGIAAIVGERIHPVRVPRMSLVPQTGPKLTYRRMKAGRQHYLTSASGHPNGLFEIVAWSQSYDQAKALANAVRVALDGFGGSTFTDIAVGSVKNTDEEDDFFEPEDGSDGGWYAVILEYQIRYSESIPTFA